MVSPTNVEQIERVQNGLDPDVGVVADGAAEEVIDFSRDALIPTWAAEREAREVGKVPA